VTLWPPRTSAAGAAAMACVALPPAGVPAAARCAQASASFVSTSKMYLQLQRRPRPSAHRRRIRTRSAGTAAELLPRQPRTAPGRRRRSRRA
jgi:hypothetical protein